MHKEDIPIFTAVLALLIIVIAVMVYRHFNWLKAKKAQEKFFSKSQIKTTKSFKEIHDYFLEKGWGEEGVKWHVVSADPEARKIVAEFRYQEGGGTSGAYILPIGDIEAIVPVGSILKSRFAQCKIVLVTDPKSGATFAKLTWTVNYTEAAGNHGAPDALYAVCQDVVFTGLKK